MKYATTSDISSGSTLFASLESNLKGTEKNMIIKFRTCDPSKYINVNHILNNCINVKENSIHDCYKKIPSILNLHNLDEIAFEAFCSIGTLFIEA